MLGGIDSGGRGAADINRPVYGVNRCFGKQFIFCSDFWKIINHVKFINWFKITRTRHGSSQIIDIVLLKMVTQTSKSLNIQLFIDRFNGPKNIKDKNPIALFFVVKHYQICTHVFHWRNIRGCRSYWRHVAVEVVPAGDFLDCRWGWGTNVIGRRGGTTLRNADQGGCQI